MDELARLVTSLTKSEKRYFRMFTALQGGEKSYLKLFDAIEKLGDCDDEKLKKLLAGEDFIKRLPAVKNYLYSHILKSLRVIYSGETIESQVKGLIDDVAILYEKRLYKQCFKILERTKELASKNELVLQLIEINIWREKILIEILNLNKFEELLSTSAEEEIHLLDLQKNIALFRNFYNRIILINKRIKEARTEEELKQFEQIINHPLLQSQDKALCYDSKHYFYLTHLIYNHAKGDYKASLYVAQDQLTLMEAFPDKIKEKPKTYISALHNVLLCRIQLHDYNNFDEILTKLRSFPAKSLNTEVNQFVSSYIFEMVKYLDTGEFQKSIDIRNDIIEGLKKYKDKINPIEETTLLYNLFYSYFGTGEFSKALSIINQLINEYQKELRQDIQSAVRILNLILHYELRNTSVLEYNAVSTNRFLGKSKRLYELETVILNFIRKKMPDIFTKQDQLEAFTQLRKEFSELADHPFEKKAFEYFDYISWADSKIENKPFEEIVKRKFGQKKN
ncbi:MAG TPA: hypothetical protein VNZ49_02465 [Bacteroidia bacterium]|jgi:hypothetical protein|nr:hypothetical protein [Bacteroidia bacterium]